MFEGGFRSWGRGASEPWQEAKDTTCLVCFRNFPRASPVPRRGERCFLLFPVPPSLWTV